MLPLSSSNMQKVAEAMRRKKYRSAVNYLVTMKRLHVEAGHSWSAQESLTFSDMSRFLTRKIGPGKRSRAFDPSKIAEAYVWGRAPVTTIVMVHHALILCTLLMLRAIELGAMDASDVVLNTAAQWVAIRVTSSKTDVTGRGFKFRWACMLRQFSQVACHRISTLSISLLLGHCAKASWFCEGAVRPSSGRLENPFHFDHHRQKGDSPLDCRSSAWLSKHP